VVSELLEHGVFDRHLVSLRTEHRRRRDAMVHALRQHVPADALRFAIPDGGMYLWCQLGPKTRARAVQEHALAESVMILTGEPFYVDQGGSDQLRLCYTSAPVGSAERVARTLARSLRAAASESHAPSAAVRLV
jgi:DNA-binding transcriptional MocR family regulator